VVILRAPVSKGRRFEPHGSPDRARYDDVGLIPRFEATRQGCATAVAFGRARWACAGLLLRILLVVAVVVVVVKFVVGVVVV
jgi:hypothetical protein